MICSWRLRTLGGAALATDISHARRLVALLRTGIAVQADAATDG